MGIQYFAIALLTLLTSCLWTFADQPAFSDYCQRLEQEIQGRKHGFLAGNMTYYVGGFHASWNLKEQETLGLTHPFHHDLRSRGVGLASSKAVGHQNTGLGNDFYGWEFYKDTRVLYGSVILNGELYENPVPKSMKWRPDRITCHYEIAGIQIREEKFIAQNDAACTVITSSHPIRLRFSGQSFFGRHSIESSAKLAYDQENKLIHIIEGGTTKCKPDMNAAERTAPIMYQGMSTILASSRDFIGDPEFSQGDRGEQQYQFDVLCDPNGVALTWAMDDDQQSAQNKALTLLDETDQAKHAKTLEINRQLNEEIPYFRCSDKKFEDIYYYLWSLYLMYYIDVGRDWEKEPHTQTAVNNFLGIHRYDSTFQIKVGSWSGNKPFYAYGNVLTWKHLFLDGYYRKSPNGVISLADNKGTNWHSGVYGNELSEHVMGAWQIYQHTGDVAFLRECYENYFREVFRERIAPFYSNHFEVTEILIAMARETGNEVDVASWKQLVSLDSQAINKWFKDRWEIHGHKNYFGGPQNGMLMTTGFWHLRSKYFPRHYAVAMTRDWATNKQNGFYGDFFPLAMSRQAMQSFASEVDHSFGYTPDTAYFTLSGMFQQRLGQPSWQLTLNHLENYNYHSQWKIPVAPEAYTRAGELFGDQFSNFNAGKLLLFLEGLAGIEYSIPDDAMVIRDTMPTDWQWMEFKIPIRMPNEVKNRWPSIRYERRSDNEITIKTIQVSDSPLRITIEPWTENKRVVDQQTHPKNRRLVVPATYPDGLRYTFNKNQPEARVDLRLSVQN